MESTIPPIQLQTDKVHKDKMILKLPPPWNFKLIWNVHKGKMTSNSHPVKSSRRVTPRRVTPRHVTSSRHVITSRHPVTSCYHVTVMLSFHVVRSSCHAIWSRHLVTSFCHVIWSRHFVTSFCHHFVTSLVTSFCHVILSRHFVTSSCHVILSRHFVSHFCHVIYSSCHVILSRHLVTSSCHVIPSHVTSSRRHRFRHVTSSRHVTSTSRHPVTSSRHVIPSRHPVTSRHPITSRHPVPSQDPTANHALVCGPQPKDSIFVACVSFNWSSLVMSCKVSPALHGLRVLAAVLLRRSPPFQTGLSGLVLFLGASAFHSPSLCLSCWPCHQFCKSHRYFQQHAKRSLVKISAQTLCKKRLDTHKVTRARTK